MSVLAEGLLEAPVDMRGNRGVFVVLSEIPNGLATETSVFESAEGVFRLVVDLGAEDGE